MNTLEDSPPLSPDLLKHLRDYLDCQLCNEDVTQACKQSVMQSVIRRIEENQRNRRDVFMYTTLRYIDSTGDVLVRSVLVNNMLGRVLDLLLNDELDKYKHVHR